jgi:hypothetical protein
MEFAKRKCWINGDRCLCEFERDGSVTFKDDVSIEELKWLVGALLRDAEYKRQCRIGLGGEEAEAALDKIEKINKKAAQDAALSEMVRLSEEMGLYDDNRPNPLIKDPPFKCPDCRCQPGCCCCREGFCGCKENRIEIDESKVF